MANENDAEGILVILVDREGRLLLQLREDKQGIALPGVWCVPGGALEPGESPSEATRRELQEETGQAVEPLHFVASVRPDRRTAHVFSGGARFAEAAIVVGEGQAFRFFSWEEIRRLQPTAPFIIPLLNDFVAGPLYKRCRQDAQRP
jgi:8-oxo-dGTP pyrophosphatase MutT (NUDIX family)